MSDDTAQKPPAKKRGRPPGDPYKKVPGKPLKNIGKPRPEGKIMREARQRIVQEALGDNVLIPGNPINPFVENLPDLLSGDLDKINAIIANFDDATLKAATQTVLGYSAREDSPLGYKDFYQLIFGRPIPPHAYYEWVIPGFFVQRKVSWEWVQQAYENLPYDWLLLEMERWVERKPTGLLIEAFRGSTKSTTITVGMTAFNLAHNPVDPCLFIQAGDESAEKFSAAVAEIIARNEGWKLAFPWVIPDEKRGWGARGYWVRDTRLPDNEWYALKGGEKDPSLLGLSYQSKEAPGKHPKLLVIDDIHDESNTSSTRELENTKKIVSDTVMPMLRPDTWLWIVGTPWVENDVIGYYASTDQFLHVKTPIYRDKQGGSIADAITPTWPDLFGIEQIETRRKFYLDRPSGFARMYLLDLTVKDSRFFKYMSYPNSEIKYNWPMAGGVDYAGSGDEYQNRMGKGDFFAMAYVAKLPGGGLVCTDGVIDRSTQAQSENYINRAQEIFPLWKFTNVEKDGSGEGFIQTMRRNPRMKINPVKTGGKSKGYRYDKFLSPYLESGRVRISDGDTQFLNELRKELNTWPNSEHDDAIDALLWAVLAFPEELGTVYDPQILEKHGQPVRQENPFGSFAKVLNAR